MIFLYSFGRKLELGGFGKSIGLTPGWISGKGNS
jgi:hypothetical protein